MKIDPSMEISLTFERQIVNTTAEYKYELKDLLRANAQSSCKRMFHFRPEMKILFFCFDTKLSKCRFFSSTLRGRNILVKSNVRRWENIIYGQNCGKKLGGKNGLKLLACNLCIVYKLIIFPTFCLDLMS